jgi:4-hydroxy-tetrahydrodipicolinate synthase
MVRLFAMGDSKGALKIHAKLFPLFRNLFIETNPVPVKAALAMKGMMNEEYRLPLVKMDAKNRDVLRKTLESCGVLS